MRLIWGILLVILGSFSTSVLWAHSDIRTYGSSAGLGLRYVVTYPHFEKDQSQASVWIYQPGDGDTRSGFSPFVAKIMGSYLSRRFGMIFVAPELTREALASDLKSYCELDFFHRTGDLNALIDAVKSDSRVDQRKIFLVGFSAGAEIVTKAATERHDIAGVATIGGGTVELARYLEANNDPAEKEYFRRGMANNCTEGHYKERSGLFWEQLVHSGLDENIKKLTIPYLAIVGLKDSTSKASVYRRFVSEIQSQKPKFAYEEIEGLRHMAFCRAPWVAVYNWMRGL